jgi:hypothetical protein
VISLLLDPPEKIDIFDLAAVIVDGLKR